MDERDVDASGTWERLRLGAWVVAAGVVPVWLLLAASVAQVHPELQAVQVQLDTGEVIELGYTPFQRFVLAGGIAASALVALGLVVTPVVLGVGALRRWRTGRETLVDVLPDDLVAGAAFEVEVRRDGDVAAVEAVPAPEAPSPADALPVTATEPPADDPPPADDDLDALFRRDDG